jgi:hypothetical protein
LRVRGHRRGRVAGRVVGRVVRRFGDLAETLPAGVEESVEDDAGQYEDQGLVARDRRICRRLIDQAYATRAGIAFTAA